MAVGGAFDYISGQIRRAPKWIRDLGFEWFYRLVRQPWRIKRQLALPKFIILVAKQKFSKA
jgi:N-acetylglucosaminyldiphosphoundecaprenol N-acetyl-beta-D-mannosaminyltransferase